MVKSKEGIRPVTVASKSAILNGDGNQDPAGPYENVRTSNKTTTSQNTYLNIGSVQSNGKLQKELTIKHLYM